MGRPGPGAGPGLQLENLTPEWQEGVSLRTPKSLPVRFRGT